MEEELNGAQPPPNQPSGNGKNGANGDTPRPLYLKISASEPYPVKALGPVLGPAAQAIHDIVRAPLAICAQSVLGAAAFVAQTFVNVRLPIPGAPIRPVSLYLLTI